MDLSGAVWRKSSRSNGPSDCVSWADLGDAVAVRDDKHPDGPVLVFTLGEWRAFVAGIKDGEGDL